MPQIRLLSSDLNGTLVHPHTMQEMIRFGFPEEPWRYERAREAFGLQTDGRLPMGEAFQLAGEMTRGLSLRQAMDYAQKEMSLMEGYPALMTFLVERGVALAIVSTGYTVTLYALRHGLPTSPFHARCNRLRFAHASGPVLGEDELEALVRGYVQDLDARRGASYDVIRATGEVILGIQDEAHKAQLALDLARRLGIPPQEVAHMGDTMGDSGGILGVAQAGGLGIAFNYNGALEAFLTEEVGDLVHAGRIALVDPKGSGADLAHVLPLLEGGRVRVG